MAIVVSLDALLVVGLLGTLKSLKFRWGSIIFSLASCSLFILQKLGTTQHAIIIWPTYGTVKLRHLITFQLFLRWVKHFQFYPYLI